MKKKKQTKKNPKLDLNVAEEQTYIEYPEISDFIKDLVIDTLEASFSEDGEIINLILKEKTVAEADEILNIFRPTKKINLFR